MNPGVARSGVGFDSHGSVKPSLLRALSRACLFSRHRTDANSVIDCDDRVYQFDVNLNIEQKVEMGAFRCLDFFGGCLSHDNKASSTEAQGHRGTAGFFSCTIN